MPEGYLKEFTHDPQADLPYEISFLEWLEGDTLATAAWAVTKPALLDMHDDTIIETNSVARIWLLGKGVEGDCHVKVHVVSADGRKDDRTLYIKVRHR